MDSETSEATVELHAPEHTQAPRKTAVLFEGVPHGFAEDCKCVPCTALRKAATDIIERKACLIRLRALPCKLGAADCEPLPVPDLPQPQQSHDGFHLYKGLYSTREVIISADGLPSSSETPRRASLARSLPLSQQTVQTSQSPPAAPSAPSPPEETAPSTPIIAAPHSPAQKRPPSFMMRFGFRVSIQIEISEDMDDNELTTLQTAAVHIPAAHLCDALDDMRVPASRVAALTTAFLELEEVFLRPGDTAWEQPGHGRTDIPNLASEARDDLLWTLGNCQYQIRVEDVAGQRLGFSTELLAAWVRQRSTIGTLPVELLRSRIWLQLQSSLDGHVFLLRLFGEAPPPKGGKLYLLYH